MVDIVVLLMAFLYKVKTLFFNISVIIYIRPYVKVLLPGMILL
jgi:hypothetical protein